MAIGAAAGIVALLVVLYSFILPHRSEATTTGAETATADRAAQQPAPVSGSHPLAKHLEVSGVRIQESTGGKVKIDFNVVNHSAADLPDLKLEVRLRSGNREYFVIPVTLPSLGPYASKNLSTVAKTDLKPYELPDWQRIEPRVTVEDAGR